MRYHNITHDDMLNGDGLRVVVWEAGCSHFCEGCQNPITWDPNGGLEFDADAKAEVFDQLDKNYIEGITFSGGDPLHTANVKDTEELAKEIKEKYPDKNIWVYTGGSWEDIYDLTIMKYIDVLVDGEFMQCKKDATLLWKGSSNQRVIDVQATIDSNTPEKPILHCGNHTSKTGEDFSEDTMKSVANNQTDKSKNTCDC